MSIFFFTSSGETPTANEHKPRPSSPTWAWPSSLVVAPQIGGCGCCNGFGCTRRSAHRPVLAVERIALVGPRTDDVLDRFAPHLARVLRVDAESFELDARRRAAGAHVDAAVAQQVEHRDRLRRPHRMVVRLRHQTHAVAEPHLRRAARDRAVEHLGVRAVRVLLEEVVLDRPERVEAGLLRPRSPVRACSCRRGVRCRATHGRATGIS